MSELAFEFRCIAADSRPLNVLNLWTKLIYWHFRGKRRRNNRKINSMFKEIGWIGLAWTITNSRRFCWLKSEEFIHSLRWGDLKSRLIRKNSIEMNWAAFTLIILTVIVRCKFEPWIRATKCIHFIGRIQNVYYFVRYPIGLNPLFVPLSPMHWLLLNYK